MRPLEGQRVALLESRKAADLARLVERQGGVVLSAPSVREIPRTEQVGDALRRLVAGDFAVLVALTGTACEALFKEAEHLGLAASLLEALSRMTIACRGPKPLLVFNRRELPVLVRTASPHTSDDLLEALDRLSLEGQRVLLLEYGERSELMTRALESRGANVTALCLYEWALPEDLSSLSTLISETVAGRVDVMLFTSQIQIRHLLQVAAADGQAESLVRALRDQVTTGAVGPVCAHALRVVGLIPDVIPARPNSASLVQAVGDYLQCFQGASSPLDQ